MAGTFFPILRQVEGVYRQHGLDPEAPEVGRIADGVVNWVNGMILGRLTDTILCADCDAVVAGLADEDGPEAGGPDLGLPFSASASGRAQPMDILEAACEEVRWAERKAMIEDLAYPQVFIYDFDLGEILWIALDAEEHWRYFDPENGTTTDLADSLTSALWGAIVPWVEFTMLRQLLEHLCPRCRHELETLWYRDDLVEELEEDEENQVG